MDKEIYLVFIENVCTNLDEKNVYHFYFSDRPEVVWGEYWNICPVSIVPSIKPDILSISRIYEIETDTVINLVTENSCFSMQDCIDQIIALGWFDTFAFRFGENINNVKAILNNIHCSLETFPIVYEKQDESEEMIDNLIEKLGGDGDGLEW